MNQMNICKPQDIRVNIMTYFANNSLVPIVGSGLSCGLTAKNGIVPSGKSYQEYMLKALTESGRFSESEIKELNICSFSNLCDYYEDDDNVSPNTRFQYLKNNFYRASFNETDSRKKFLEIDWPYIYSLNIDDAIENSSTYKTVILPYEEYRDEIFLEEKCLIKLHGDIAQIVRSPNGSKIFTSKEYALSIELNSELLTRLKNDYAYQNILYIGCSLDDEFDLKTLTRMPVDYKTKDNLSKTILLMKGQPGKLQLSKFKSYGITDVVCFEEYDEIFDFLFDTWTESKQIAKSHLSEYSQLKIQQLGVHQRDINHNFFFWGTNLLNSKERTISYPFYFISRSTSVEIVKNLPQNRLHLIQGGHISGKSYLLADLYRTIRDRNVYFFDGKSRLSDAAIDALLDTENSVVLLDTGSLSKEQFEYILLSANKIHQQSNNFITVLNHSDGDLLGLIKWKLLQNEIQGEDIIQYSLENRLADTSYVNEISTINTLLPRLNLLPYEPKRTIINHLILNEHKLATQGRFACKHIVIKSFKDLALLIIFAIKERLFSSEVVRLSLESEIFEAINQYSPIIEKIEAMDFEKDASDLSSVKYILNSKYWLQRELGSFARQEKNYAIIADAYRYLIQKALESAGSNKFKQRKMCKNYILFDVMNDIFLDQYRGNLKLIVHIYTSLHNLLAQDFNFLHQNAKCYLNYAYSLRSEKDKLKFLKDAHQLAEVSNAIASSQYNALPSESLMISISHIHYTIATILSEICNIQNHTDTDMAQKAIDAISIALNSPYNIDGYRRDISERTSHGIVNLFESATQIYALDISDIHRRKLDELISEHWL